MNPRLVFRDVGRKGQPYPDWIRELVDKSGIYVIRSRRSRKVLYVGESHTGRLYGTLTRHFQGWNREVNEWDPYWGRATGRVYDRAAVEVAVYVTRADRAAVQQWITIQKLHPRDNQLEGATVVQDEIPF